MSLVTEAQLAIPPARSFPALNSPLTIGGIVVRNRLLLTAMTTRLAAEDGTVTEDLIQYYEERGRGGVGLVTVELTSPIPGGAHRRREVGIYDDRFLPGLKTLVDRIHATGAKASIQIGHAGAHARPDVSGEEAIAPSAVPHVVREGDSQTVTPRPLNADELPGLANAYAAAAKRCVAAGFDFIELQGGHDYLLFQFLSPLDNHREDEYGGSLPNRARFPLEVVTAVKKAICDTPLVYRFSADEFAPGGFTQQDGITFAKMLEDTGVAMINVSAGSARSTPIPWLITTPMAYPAGLFVPLASAIKREVRIPVAVAGRLNDPAFAEQVLANGDADVIAMGRGLIADPAWLNHANEGGTPAIQPCIACNTCVDHLRSGGRMECLVNPLTGNEARYRALTEDAPRLNGQIVVIGGGPAGLTAATNYAKRGARVTLYEKSPSLGGRLHSIAKAPRFQVVETNPEPFERLAAYLERKATEAGVSVTVGREPGYDEIRSLHPTLVVSAGGAVYRLPGLLHTLKLPGVRKLASLPRLHKLFFKMLRTPQDRMVNRLEASGISVVRVGDRSGTRGVEAAIRAGYEAGSGARLTTKPTATAERKN